MFRLNKCIDDHNEGLYTLVAYPDIAVPRLIVVLAVSILYTSFQASHLRMRMWLGS